MLRKIKAKYAGRCKRCRERFPVGSLIYYNPEHGAICLNCRSLDESSLPSPISAPAVVNTDGSTSIWVRITNCCFRALLWICGLAVVGYLLKGLWPLIFLVALINLVVWLLNIWQQRNRSRLTWFFAFLLAGLVGLGYDYWDGGIFSNYPMARCRDGTYSYSANRRGTCSWHGGVARWRPDVPWWRRF